MSNSPRWLYGPLEDNQWPQKMKAKIFPSDFSLRIIWGGVSRSAFTPLTFALSPSHSEITRLRPWSPNATGNYLFSAEKIPNLPHTSGTVDICDLRSGISGNTSRRASSCPNLHELWTQPAHERCPAAQLLINRNAEDFLDYLVHLINNLRGYHGFGSSRTGRITGGNITTFNLGHPVPDCGIQWCMFH